MENFKKWVREFITEETEDTVTVETKTGYTFLVYPDGNYFKLKIDGLAHRGTFEETLHLALYLIDNYEG